MSGSKSSNPAAELDGRPESVDRPLDLAVHAPPDLTAMGAAPERRLGRLKMLAILLLCASPVIASYLAYYFVRPEGRQNYGHLIQPQRAIPEQTALNLEGVSVKLNSLKGQWLLLSTASGACDAACQQRLYLQRQLRESLGKGKDRMDWVWIIHDEVSPPASIRPALEAATVLRLPLPELSKWLQPDVGKAIHEHLYLVDPMGNLMQRFPAELDTTTAAKAKRDLERLLRASASWDLPGR